MQTVIGLSLKNLNSEPTPLSSGEESHQDVIDGAQQGRSYGEELATRVCSWVAGDKASANHQIGGTSTVVQVEDRNCSL